MAQQLPSTCEAQSLIPGTTKTKEKCGREKEERNHNLWDAAKTI